MRGMVDGDAANTDCTVVNEYGSLENQVWSDYLYSPDGIFHLRRSYDEFA